MRKQVYARGVTLLGFIMKIICI